MVGNKQTNSTATTTKAQIALRSVGRLRKIKNLDKEIKF